MKAAIVEVDHSIGRLGKIPSGGDPCDRCLWQLHFGRKGAKVGKIDTPPKINMEHNHGGLEDDVPF